MRCSRKDTTGAGLGLCIVALACLIAVFTATPACATWSMVVTNTRTGEVAIGQATCVGGYDLLYWTPVLVTGRGAATVAGYLDNVDHARGIIRDELLAGTPPDSILQILSDSHPEHERHQYCIVDVGGGAATYTGTVAGQEFDWAGGQAGRVGDIAYSVTGGLLTGAPVVEEAVNAIITTDGDVAARLMAGMEAARSMGGDGRCSCSPSDPTGCGSPPASFEFSAINGYMVLARSGDTAVCIHCSGADLFLRFNVAYQNSGDPDPVLLMQEMYDTWRAALVGRPDAVRSIVTFDPAWLPPDGVSETEMTIQLLDWQGLPPTGFITLTVTHAADSDSLSSIGEPINHGGGQFTVAVTAGTELGVDRFLVTTDHWIRPVVLMPEPALLILDPTGVPATGSPIHAMELHQNYPNPCNPATSIAFELPEATHVRLWVYDIGGRLVRTLVDARLAGDAYVVEWDGCDERGRSLGSGVYCYRLETGSHSLTRKLVILE